MAPLLISAAQLNEDNSLLPVDVRPPEERWGEYGLIPGSFSSPMEEPWTRLWVPDELLSRASGVVLVCLSGHRASLAWRTALRQKPVMVLDGGALAWGASGFPLAGSSLSQEVFEGVSTFSAFYRALRACFVAEWIESSLNQNAETSEDPVQLFAACFEAEQVSETSWAPDGLRRVLDRLARLSLHAGTAPAKVAVNLSVMLNTISLLSQTQTR
jgi:rhodanese-related sulfurtransferase